MDLSVNNKLLDWIWSFLLMVVINLRVFVWE